jgi:hypothetical protein
MVRQWLPISIVALAILLVFQSGSAVAYELELTGSFNWAFEFYNQRGAQGLFGPYDLDNGAGTTTANLNYWFSGARLQSPMFITGSDVSRSYFYVLFEPTLKLNEAIRFKGRYRLGQYGNPAASYYLTQDSPGTDNAFSEGQWTMFWATAVTPWGSLGIGKRPWKFGTGLQYDGTDGLTTESMLISAPYGPMDIGVGFYPHRPTGQPASPSNSGDPFDLIAPQYYNHADKGGSLQRDFFAYVMYHQGPAQVGILASYGSYRVGPEARLVNPTGAGPLPNTYLAQDSEYFHGTVFVRYFNGRFFYNSEAAWLYWTDRLSGPGVLAPAAPLPPILTPTPRYVEQWRLMAEAGVVSGPMKLSLLYARTPGPDRRNFTLIGKQQAAFVWHPTFDRHLANYDVFRPYSFLLSYGPLPLLRNCITSHPQVNGEVAR